MSAVADLIGHDAAWGEWRAAFAGPRAHHAWILAGREGLGKASFALAAASELVRETGVSQPPAQSHPDIIRLVPLPANEDEARKQEDGRPYLTKRNISIDQVRAMQRRLVTRPTLGARRAVVIDSADLLEKGAVNALLKSLEEPPAGTFFLLISHQPGRLLPTIRSRCRILRFHPLDDTAMRDALAGTELAHDGRALDAAITVAAGSPGAAIAFAAQELAHAVEIMVRLVTSGDPDFALRAQLSTAIGQRPDRDRIQAVIEAARRVMTAHLAHGDDAARLRIADAHARLVTLASQAPIYNFDAGLLVLEIGALLASVAR